MFSGHHEASKSTLLIAARAESELMFKERDRHRNEITFLTHVGFGQSEGRLCLSYTTLKSSTRAL